MGHINGSMQYTGTVKGSQTSNGDLKGSIMATILKGDPGKSAYESAIEGGYTGTESEFYTVLANVSGENDYEKLSNKPSIEDVTLIGNKTFDELGMSEASNLDIEAILQS